MRGSAGLLSADARAELAGDLRRVGYLVGDTRGADRGAPDSYFEKDLVLTRPGVLESCARLMSDEVPESADRLAAQGAAAIALAAGIALHARIPLLFGCEDGQFAGDGFPNANVVVVTDVLLTGQTALSQVAALRKTGLNPVRVLALLDRDRGARATLLGSGVDVRALFTEHELADSIR